MFIVIYFKYEWCHNKTLPERNSLVVSKGKLSNFDTAQQNKQHFRLNELMFILLLLYFACHHMSEWIQAQTLQPAVLVHPKRMFSYKYTKILI